jgi:hypothetical protein
LYHGIQRKGTTWRADNPKKKLWKTSEIENNNEVSRSAGQRERCERSAQLVLYLHRGICESKITISSWMHSGLGNGGVAPVTELFTPHTSQRHDPSPVLALDWTVSNTISADFNDLILLGKRLTIFGIYIKYFRNNTLINISQKLAELDAS